MVSGEGKVIAGAQKESVNELNCSREGESWEGSSPVPMIPGRYFHGQKGQMPKDAAAVLGGGGCGDRDGTAEGQKIHIWH